MPNPSLKVYRSSAGSGKTYQLALEYICLALAVPGNFRHILAVTFTNKAMREMKSRIISFLWQLSEGANPALLQQVKNSTGLAEALVQDRAATALSQILHEYGHFAVSTIDAFFQRILRAFAREMGLLGNYKVELDENAVRDAIIDLTLADVGSDKRLTKWLVDFASSNIENNKTWDIRKDIERLAGEIFTEHFKSFEAGFQKHAADSQSVQQFLGNLQKVKSKFEQEASAMATACLQAIEKKGLQASDFKNKEKGPAGWLAKVALKKDFELSKRASNAAEGMNEWYVKSSDRQSEIENLLSESLEGLFAELVEYLQQHLPLYLAVDGFMRNAYTFGILSDIMKQLQFYRQENDVMLISDVNAFLKGIISANDSPFIYEKTGAWYRHFLMDEFQDTSRFQWDNFKPLIENSLAEGHQNLVVGDAKQSIYRWRGGDWALLAHGINEEIRPDLLDEKALQTNWRSERRVVWFNNALFTVLPHILQQFCDAQMDDPDAYLPEGQTLDFGHIFGSLYQGARQEVPAWRKDEGYVEVQFTEQDDTVEAWHDTALDWLVQRIERLEDHGYMPRDMAVLVRNKQEGNLVVDRLIREKNNAAPGSPYRYDVVSNESLFLHTSAAIRLIVNAIKFIQNPADDIARNNIIFDHLEHVAPRKDGQPGKPFTSQEILALANDGSDLTEALPAAFLDQQHALKRKTLPELTEALIRIFRLHKNPKNQAFLQAFQDAILKFAEDNPANISTFLQWWEEKGQTMSVEIPEDIDAIRVLTVHKSKGLEFDAVLVPFCDWKMDHNAHHDNYLWCHQDRWPFDAFELVPLKYGSRLKKTIFSRDYLEEFGKVHIDNLNLLYVAFTRAARALLVNGALPKEGNLKNGKISSVSDLIYQGITTESDPVTPLPVWPLAQYFDPEKKTLSIGSIPAQKASEIQEGNLLDIREFQSADWQQKISIRKKSKLYFNTDWTERHARLNFGILVHEILSKINTREDVEKEIGRMKSEGLLSVEDEATVHNQFEAIFAMPQVKSWFSEGWQVKTEGTILSTDGHQYRPDRVLTKGNHAVIIDFKTGAETPHDKSQVRQYVGIMRNMGFDQVEAFLLYTQENKIVEVVG